MKLVDLIDRYKNGITDAVVKTYPPIYNAEVRRTCGFDLRRLLRRPLGAQADAIRATALSLQRHPGTNVVGGMGTGKTMIAASAAYLAGMRRTLVIAPPHLVRKWAREVRETVPNARVAIVRTIRDLERARSDSAFWTQFVICSRERAKLGYRWAPAVVARPIHDDHGRLIRGETDDIVRLLCCSDCCAPAVDDEDVPLGWVELSAKKRRCRSCGNPLWQADRTGPRRFPLADYVARRMRGYFDLLVLDEVHEMKARGSAQGLAAAQLAEVCGRTLTLTGTFSGGYASTLFHLLFRFSPEIRQEFGYRDEAKWIQRYGIIERVSKRDPDEYGDEGRQSKRRAYAARTIERPGIAPAALFHVVGNSLFLRLADVASDLPPYEERVMVIPLDAEPDEDGFSQAGCYQQLATDLRTAVNQALGRGSKRLLSTYLQALISYPDASTRGETVLDPESGAVLAEAPPLSDQRLYPKEQAILDLVRGNKERGRRTIIFLTHTERRDITPRLRSVLEQEGFRVAVLKASTVSADRREEWVAERVREGIDVLACHPALVSTGLDLIDFQSALWVEPTFSSYTLRQASRRSWRLGQKQPVEVHHLVYGGTLQADALALVAAKVKSSLMVEGDLPEDGLAALEGDGQDMFMALARRLTEADAAQEQSLEALFAQSRAIEAQAEGLLVDGEWNAEPEPIAPATLAPQGRVMTFDELVALLPQRRARPQLVPEAQLALFGI